MRQNSDSPVKLQGSQMVSFTLHRALPNLCCRQRHAMRAHIMHSQALRVKLGGDSVGGALGL